MRGQQPAQCVRNLVLLERPLHQEELPLTIEVRVRDVPAFAIGARNMAEGEIARHPIETVGRGLGEEQRIARAKRHRQAGRVIVGGVEAFRADLVDEAEQFLRIARLPQQGRIDDRRRRNIGGWRLCGGGLRRGGGQRPRRADLRLRGRGRRRLSCRPGDGKRRQRRECNPESHSHAHRQPVHFERQQPYGQGLDGLAVTYTR